MPKILISGPGWNQASQLSKVEAVNKKNGPFSALFAVGPIIGKDSICILP